MRKLTPIGVDKRGISKRGRRLNVFDEQLGDTIREKLNFTKKQLPDSVIKKIIKLQNKEISTWIANNPEEYILPDMGVLAASKHLPKELRESKEDDIETIKSLEVSPLRREQLLKRFNVDVGRRVNMNELVEFQRLLPHVNLHTYFYTYKVMWFNHRNCKSKKARAYIFEACPGLNKQLHDNVVDGKEYYEWHFQFFYKYKLGSEW